jgi:cobalt-precorrin 5A hydrolase/precorrin-3B C17-methyltransferase
MSTDNLAPAILILSDAAMPVAETVRNTTGGVIHGACKRVTPAEGIVLFEDIKAHLQSLFLDGVPIVALMASGAVIRILAPHLANKREEPAVVAVAEDGHVAVPLLGGHRGANRLAEDIAFALGGLAAVTTAGDLRFGVALDAPPDGYVLANPENAKAAMAELVAGKDAVLNGSAAWLEQSGIAFKDLGEFVLTVSEDHREPAPNELIYHPKTLAVGVGCERGCDPGEALAQVRETLASAGLAEGSVGAVVSLDLKADEAAVHHIAGALGVPARFFDAAALEAETPRLANPSEVVFAEVGCHGVSEGAALAAAGPGGELVVEKRKSARATCAVARARKPFTRTNLPGRARGALFVVGIGPGSEAWRSPEVSRMVAASTDLVGYSLYLDLLGPLAGGKIRRDFALGKEEDRVRHAMELAGEGKSVSLVCSGDAGIYAMATLVFELIDKRGVSDQARRIDVQVSPGISALQAAAARAGAPLGHDFCTISLSDLLTPWEDIQRRVKAAGEGDFVIAFYNPVSKKRRSQLAWARDELLTYRPAETPVILATNLGRDGETVRIVPLGDLNVDDVDMLTVVVVGSSDSRTVSTGDGKTRVYTPRGYSGKAGTRMGEGQ